MATSKLFVFFLFHVRKRYVMPIKDIKRMIRKIFIHLITYRLTVSLTYETLTSFDSFRMLWLLIIISIKAKIFVRYVEGFDMNVLYDMPEPRIFGPNDPNIVEHQER